MSENSPNISALLRPPELVQDVRQQLIGLATVRRPWQARSRVPAAARSGGIDADLADRDGPTLRRLVRCWGTTGTHAAVLPGPCAIFFDDIHGFPHIHSHVVRLVLLGRLWAVSAALSRSESSCTRRFGRPPCPGDCPRSSRTATDRYPSRWPPPAACPAWACASRCPGDTSAPPSGW